jgi:epoxyqueuosine reductase
LKGPGEDEARIVQRALECGASLAGIASTSALQASRSYAGGQSLGCAVNGHSLLVLALAQGAQWPEFDWWDGRPGGTPGNRRLFTIMNQVIDWLTATLTLHAQALPYNIDQGGVFLKGAAILAGLGTIGKNNLLITPDFGPRVRLRAVLIGRELAQTGPGAFDPCSACDVPCRRKCPQSAFESGGFDRKRCSIQMRFDKLERGASYLEAPIKYCRICELACPLANP